MAQRGGSAQRTCGVSGCGEEAVRSLSYQKVKEALGADLEEGRRAHLCREHYKAYKKATKVDRALDRITW